MKKILAILFLIFCIFGCFGCAEVDSDPRSRFKEGDKVSIVVNDRMGTIIRVHYWLAGPWYRLRYADNWGELHIDTLAEYELEPWKEE